MPRFKLVREYEFSAEVEAESEAQAKSILRDYTFDDFPDVRETDEFVFKVRCQRPAADG